MSITAAGLFGPTLELCLINGAAINLEAEDNKIALVTDSYTPDFTTHNDFADVTNEVSGTGYTAGGQALTGTEVTLAGGVLTYDATDPSWATSTIAAAMAAAVYADAVANELICLLDFVTAATSSGGTFLIQLAAGGIFTVDYTP